MSYVQAKSDGTLFIAKDVFDDSNQYILDELKSSGVIDYFIDEYGCRIIPQASLETPEGAEVMKAAMMKFNQTDSSEINLRNSNNVYTLN
jgi:hypothetical protein